MNQFNYDSYMKNNPLLKETDGYGNYKIPVLEYTDEDTYNNMTDDELDAAEEAGDINSSNAPLGPDEELMEESEFNFAEEFGKSLDSARETAMSAHMSAEETGDQPWINALDRIASILDQLESYVNDRDRKLGVIRKREVNN